MKRSTISWCDFSGGYAGIVGGCTPVSEGCQHCFAKAIYERFGRDFSVIRIYPEKVEKLLRVRWPQDGNVRGPHSKPIVFLADMGDLFHPAIPADFIIHAFEMMAFRRDVDWVVLTKRPERMVEVLFSAEGNYYLGGGDYCPNIILGVTAENQEMADKRVPILMGCWQGPKLVCVEPMLGPVSLTQIQWDKYTSMNVLEGCGLTDAPGMRGQSIPNCYCGKLDWVIVGGESGPHRRPFDPRWANYVWQECQGSGVPMFYKQGSALRPGQDDLLDGRQIHEWPR